MNPGSFIREHHEGVTLTVKVVPNSSRNSIDIDSGGRIIVRLKASPVEGKANKELVKFLAKRLGKPQSAVTIIQGKSSKEKILLVQGTDKESVLEKIKPE